ncbi:MAG: hypothetical protein M3N17_03215 [Actinomycetota bacterium]|nr:hypothetical protein [Actinomycetota bacterium]
MSTSLQLERDRRELQQTLARDVDYAVYAPRPAGSPPKPEIELIGRL